MNALALHPLWTVIALGLAMGSIFALPVWLERRRTARLYEGSLRPGPPKGGTTNGAPGRMSEGQREGALAELLWQWQQRGTAAFTEEAVQQICGMSPQQSAAFMHWARGQVLRPNKVTYLCKIDRGVYGTRWLRFHTVMPDGATWSAELYRGTGSTSPIKETHGSSTQRRGGAEVCGS